jgi:hypothetical protein
MVKIGRCARYEIDDLDQYIENDRARTAGAGPESVTY